MVFDAIVVGGGIIGCTHAYYLSQKGLRVAIIEKGAIGGGTTANNFSWANATSKTASHDYHRLNALGVDMYDKLTKKFGAQVIGLNPTGAIGITRRSDQVNYKAMRDQAETLVEFGYPCRWLGRDELLTLEPNLVIPQDGEAMFTPTDKCVNASHFARFMAQKVKSTGGKVFEHCAALEIELNDSGDVSGLLCDQGLLQTARLVIATGPDTPQVLGELTGYDGFSTRFPINRGPGLLVTTPPVREGFVRHLCHTDIDGEFHFLPDFNGGLRLASDDADGQIIENQSPEHLRELAVGLLCRMQGIAPDFAGKALIDDCKLAIGMRAYPEDGVSIAGAMPGAKGLFVIATHSGVTLAPALGNLMADLVADGAVAPMLAPFGLERLPGFG